MHIMGFYRTLGNPKNIKENILVYFFEILYHSYDFFFKEENEVFFKVSEKLNKISCTWIYTLSCKRNRYVGHYDIAFANILKLICFKLTALLLL